MNDGINSTRETLLKALEHSDKESRNERASRIEWLSLHSTTTGVLMGRAETLQLLEETRLSFINSNFVATLILALAFIEHCLVEELLLLGLVKKSTSFSDALSLAIVNKTFPIDWLQRAKKLSLHRNPFIHLKPEGHSKTFGARIYEEKLHPKAILEADAKDAIDLMYNFHIATTREAKF